MHPIDRIVRTTAFGTPVVEHWLEREIAQWVHPMKDRSDDPSHHERTLLPRSYISLQKTEQEQRTFSQLNTVLKRYRRCDCSSSRERERQIFHLTTHSTHFIYGYMASDIWLRTILIVRKEIRCRHIGYCYRLTARVILYAPSHRQDNTYHGLCYTSRRALAGTRNMQQFKHRSNSDTDTRGCVVLAGARARNEGRKCVLGSFICTIPQTG